MERAELVAVKNGRIQTVSANDTLRNFRQKQTLMVDCQGKSLLPGFCDAHFHLWASASHLMGLDVSPGANVSSIADIQARIHSYSKTLVPGSWIRASGYNEFYLTEKRHPTSRDLDKAAPDHPVKLTHRSSHAHVLNSLALKQVGITMYSPEPPGGLIDRYTDTGVPNGILFEMNDYLSGRVPRISDNDLNRGIRTLNQTLLSSGITSIHEASFNNELSQWESLSSLKTNKEFLPRITMALGVNGFLNKNEYSSPVDKEQLKISSVKIILDQTTGQLYPSQKELDRLVLSIHQRGLQASIHAIEEIAVESACHAIERALKKRPEKDHRHRIEHCSVCPPSLAKRLASAGIMVVTQPSFIHHSGDRYIKTVPDEIRLHLYPLNMLHGMGIVVAGSSDSPIAGPDPLTGIFAAASRRTETGNVMFPEECIDVRSALKMYTVNAAKSTFDEETKGSITPGKVADLVLLNGDPTTLPVDEIKDLEVVMTILDGDIVWQKAI